MLKNLHISKLGVGIMVFIASVAVVSISSLTVNAAWRDIKWSSDTAFNYSGSKYNIRGGGPQTWQTVPKAKTSNLTGPTATTVWAFTYDEASSSDGCKDFVYVWTDTPTDNIQGSARDLNFPNARYVENLKVPGTNGCVARGAVNIVSSDPDKDKSIQDREPVAEEGGEGADEEVCTVGALGWVICPAMSLMADAVEAVANILGGYLAFNPFAGNDNPIKTIWSNILNVANIMLALAFLFVIFSQSTSVGLSNYGIKRMLPRIIAAAILMNLSYYICQILVDISNIAGVGISSLIASTTGESFAQSVTDVNTPMKVVVATGIIAVLLFFFLIPVVLSFLAILFTIAARNALIVLLVIVSPLAFAAWILPNTEKYFKKWWELLINMLVLYPLVMIVFSASIVAANAISAVPAPDAVGGEALQGIISLLVLALPLFALPFLFKASNSVLGRINSLTRDRLQKGADSKAGQFARNKAKAYGKFGAIAAAKGVGAGGKYVGGKVGDKENPGRFRKGARKVGRGLYSGYTGIRAADQAVEQSLESRKAAREARIQEQAARLGTTGMTGNVFGAVGGDRYKAAATARVDKAFEEAVTDAAAAQKQNNYSSDRFDAIAQGKEAADEASQVAAARWVMSNGNFKQRKQLYESIDEKSSERLRQTASTQYYAKGDNKIIGSAFGGQLLDGTSGGEQGIKTAVASTIHAQKIDANSMVHDADATKLIKEVALEAVQDPSKYTFEIERGGRKVVEHVTEGDLQSLHTAATESLSNEVTRTKATAGVYSQHINEITTHTPASTTSVSQSEPEVRVVREEVTNVVPAQNTINITEAYGDNLGAFDATSLRSLISNTGGGVQRLSNRDIERIAERTRDAEAPELRQIHSELEAERTARQAREAQRQAQDTAYETYNDNINPPKTPPPSP